ncbi:phosphoglycerate mutase-like protein [Naviculisporaceae sp. PSN 640]
MPVYVHLVRHAQGYHNLSYANHALPDPDLTPKGEEQCAALCANFPFHDKITHLVASPMRRTIYTCLLSFKPSVYDAESNPKGKKVLAISELQEVSNLPCDVGSDLSKLKEEFGPAGKVDLGRLTDGWNDKSYGGDNFPTMQKLEARAKSARRQIRDLAVEYLKQKQSQSQSDKKGDEEEVHIAVVTHGGFLHFLTQDWDGLTAQVGTGWQNTEWRSYEFVDPTGETDEDARLRETRVSWRKRRGSATGLTDTEQMELRCVVQNKIEMEFAGGKVPEIPEQ